MALPFSTRLPRWVISAEHVGTHVHAVHHGALVAVFHHQILVEEAEGLLGRRGREADEVGIEVLQHLLPHIINGAVALVNHHEVVGLERHGRVVSHLAGPLRHLAHLKARPLLVARIELRLTPQHRVQPLNGRNRDLAHRIQLVRGQVLHVVQLCKLAAIVRRHVLLKLLQGLPPQIPPVH
jgi:hypothetical protein